MVDLLVVDLEVEVMMDLLMYLMVNLMVDQSYHCKLSQLLIPDEGLVSYIIDQPQKMLRKITFSL